jgi:hypothetical protein
MGAGEIIGAWVAAGVTLFIFSFLYRDNPLYRFAEYLYVGVSAGYILFQFVWNNIYSTTREAILWDKLVEKGKFHYLVPLVFGILLLMRLIPRLAWLSRISLAFVLGYAAGQELTKQIASYILEQIEATVKPLIGPGVTVGEALTGLIVFIGVMSVLFYFFFSVERRGIGQGIARIGIIFLMVYFGVAYGVTVMGRFSLLYGRFVDLVNFSSRQYGYATLVILVLMIVMLAFTRRREV